MSVPAAGDRLADLLLQLGRRLDVGDERRVADPLSCLGQAGDMVAVGMGDEDVGDLDAVALGPLQQRPEVVVAVDQHALAARLVGDQVGVRQPRRVLGALDDHGVAEYCGFAGSTWTSGVSDSRIPNSVRPWGPPDLKRSTERATVLEVDVRIRSTPVPGLRPVLLAVLLFMALMADTRIASAAPGGAGQGVAPPPPKALEINPGPAP